MRLIEHPHLLMIVLPVLAAALLLAWMLLRLGPPEAGDRLRGTGLVKRVITVGGRRRLYLLAVPPRAAMGPLMPLILVFHGGGGNGAAIARKTRLHEKAAALGWLVAYPYGTGHNRSERGLNWNAGGQPPRGWPERIGVDDLGFVRALLDELCREFPVDRERIYAAGMSKGGMLTYHLACRMSESFAAVAAVAATMTSADCAPARPVPLLHIHGTADRRVPLGGWRGRWPPVERGLALWRRVNGCGKVQRRSARPGAACLTYVGGDGRTDVVLWLIRGGGHEWPGAQRRWWPFGRQSRASFSATDEIIRFFQEHRRRELRTADLEPRRIAV